MPKRRLLQLWRVIQLSCMKRVVVIGSPGSGKTTFSKKLAKKFNLPLYHLDFYYHDSQFNYQTDKDAWGRKVLKLVQKPEWIIDGNYKSTFDIRFQHADSIIFLDYPRAVTVRRAIMRRIKLHSKVRSDMPVNWKEKFTFGLLKFIWSYNKIERPKLYESLEKERACKQVIILRNSRQAEQYLDDI